MLPVRLSCHRSIGQSVIHCLFLCPLCCLSDYHATILSVSRSFFVYSCDLCCLSDYHVTALSVSRSFIVYSCDLCCLSDYHVTALLVSRSFIVYSCSLYAACQIMMPPLYRSVGHSLFILAPFMLPVRL